MNKLKSIFAAILLGLVASIAAASPAFAAGPGPAGYTSVWDVVPVTSAAWAIQDPPAHAINTCYEMPSGSNDKASYVDNHTSHDIRFYKDTRCGGASYFIYATTFGPLTSASGNNSWTSYRYLN